MADPYTIPFDISGFYCLPQNVLLSYRENWNTFNRIQSYNIGISTQKAQGATTLYYYQYTSFVEKNAFRQGNFLHVRRYPNSNWDPVPEN
jgi:hypothetical protein